MPPLHLHPLSSCVILSKSDSGRSDCAELEGFTSDQCRCSPQQVVVCSPHFTKDCHLFSVNLCIFIFCFFSSITLVYYINMLPVHLRRECCCSLTAKYQDWVFNVQPPKGQIRACTYHLVRTSLWHMMSS